MKRKSTATAALDSQLGRAMRKMLEQMDKSEERGEKSEERSEESEEREAEDYRRGGRVRGPGTATSDSILARISNGEYILPKPAVDMVGANNLEAIRLEALRRSGVTPNAASPRDNMGRKKYLQGGAITGIGRYVAKNPEKALSMALGKVANVGTGYGGGLGMLLNTQDAVAPTMDVTKEKAYQRAYNAVQAGKGGKANLREWNITSNLVPPSNQEILDRYNQQQAETDAMVRAQGGIAPSDLRALADMNRFNQRAYVPGYALGGQVSGGINFQSEQEPTSTTFYPRQLPKYAQSGLNNTPNIPINNQYGNRPDGTPKGNGFLGPLQLTGGGIATEYSAQSQAVKDNNGKQIDFPTLVPTLTQDEIKIMTTDVIPNRKRIPENIMQKAITHARDRISKGLSVFAEEPNSKIVPNYALGGLAFGGSGLNIQTPGEYTATTFAPSTTINPMTTGTAIGGGMRQSSAQPTGTTNQYGNDMSLTNRMNAGTDQLRAMRTGTATAAPTPQQPDFMTGLKSLLNPQQQAQDAYKAARGRADALDVASGRFDREYAPGFALGGLIGERDYPTGTLADLSNRYPAEMAQEQNRSIGMGALMLPATIMRPTVNASRWMIDKASALLPESSTAQAEKLAKRLNPGRTETNPYVYNALNPTQIPAQSPRPPNLPRTDVEFIQRINATNPPGKIPTDQDLGASPGRGAAPRTPTVNMMAGKQYISPAPPTFSGQYNPLAGRLPDVGGFTGYYPPQGQAPAPLPTTPGPGAGGYENRGEFYRKVEPAPGFGPANPNRVPAPGQIAGTTTYTVPGETGMGGGTGQATFQGLPKPGGSLGYVGTPETKGMTQAEATAYNVANLNRQYEALKSRNEAYGLGGGNIGSALPAAPAPVDIWARPGDSFGDSQMRQAQYESLLNNAGRQRGLGAKRRAAAMIDAAQALVAPGLAAAKMDAEQAQAMTQGLMGLQASERQRQASERQKAIAAQQAQQAAEQEQKNWDAQFNFNRTKAQVDAMEKDRTYLMDVLKATPDLDDNAMLKIREQFMRDVPPTKENPTGGKVFNEQEFRGALGVETFTGNTQPRLGKVYYKEDENAYMLATPEGLVEIGGPDEYLRYRHRQIQQQQRNALLGR